MTESALSKDERAALLKYWAIESEGQALGVALRELMEDIRHFNQVRRDLEAEEAKNIAWRDGQGYAIDKARDRGLGHDLAVVQLRLEVLQAEHDRLQPRAQSLWATRDSLRHALVAKGYLKNMNGDINWRGGE